MTDTQKEPLPCPFCKATDFERIEIRGGRVLLFHPDNGCRLNVISQFSFFEHNLDWWNTRPREAELEARVEALESFARDAWTLAASLHHSHNKFEPFRDYEFYSDVRRRALTTLNKQGGGHEGAD